MDLGNSVPAGLSARDQACVFERCNTEKTCFSQIGHYWRFKTARQEFDCRYKVHLPKNLPGFTSLCYK